MDLTPCLLSTARKEGRYREPPPTPPGYVGIPIADFPEGPCHPARKPPDYNVALQRSRMVARPTEAPAPVQTPPAASRPGSKPQWHKPSDADPCLAPFQPQGFAGAEEDGKLPTPTPASRETYCQLQVPLTWEGQSSGPRFFNCLLWRVLTPSLAGERTLL